MTQLLDKPAEQRFIQTGVSWENFLAIQKGFADFPGVRLFYFEGELEILSTSPEHEIVKGNIGYLIEDYMLKEGIEFVATGSFSQEKEAVASVQADESYCFGETKPVPDLAIEVVITSGGLNKLKRYSALGVKEVWFWEDGAISMHYLNGNEYIEVQQSYFLPNLNTNRLAQCAIIESRYQAVRAFRIY
ncbi:MAG: Uma2 family endonuclease [Scytonema sp. PMC 1070.18]|nr:Uma2 family endonuclease [Scytonema sp. PMC 1070.18]